VAAAIAMMLETNPNLTPAQVKDILQRTATPLPNYYYHEVGAGMLNAHAAVLESAFPDRRFGSWRAALDTRTIQFTGDAPQTFANTVLPSATCETTISIPDSTTTASVQIAWGGTVTVNDLGLTVIAPNGSSYAVNEINLPGLDGRRERLVLNSPMAGTWRVRVSSSLLSLTPQAFVGAVEVTRAQFGTINDIDSLTAAARADIYQVLRTRAMTSYVNRFRPVFNVTRAGLAESLVYSAAVPQYLAAQPRYTDVRDLTTRNFVESVQFSSASAFFPEDGSNRFRPDNFVDRLTAAIVLVRAAGLRSVAEASNSTPLTVLDGTQVPYNLRGYVTVALSRGLLNADNNYFRSQSSLTRAELAHALTVIEQLELQ
jgi:serine protease AprX